GRIRTLDDQPDPCPEELDGNFWPYWHAEAGGDWESYMVGADESEPAPGEIEGWRYSTGEEGPQITPAALLGEDAGEDGDTGASEDADTGAPAETDDSSGGAAAEEDTGGDDTGDTGEDTSDAANPATDASDGESSAGMWIGIVAGIAIIGAVIAMLVRRRNQLGDLNEYPVTASAGTRGRAARERSRAPAAVHPLAWWAWAAGAAVAITRIGNPLVLALLTAAVIVVGLSCRSRTPWSRALEASLVLGGIVIAVRTGFYVLVGLPDSTSVLVDLPGVDLPNWFTNLTLLGPIHVGGLVQALIEGLRLGGLIVVFGAANALANPRRALRHLPGSLHHLGTAAVIAVSAV